MGHNANYLRNIGLTNHQSESYGDFASSKPKTYHAAFCSCGYSTRDTQKSYCSWCSKSLCWQTLPLETIQTKEINQRKMRAKRLALETLNNMARIEIPVKDSYGWKTETCEVPVSALTKKLLKTLNIESLKWEFTTSSVIIRTLDGTDKAYQIGKVK